MDDDVMTVADADTIIQTWTPSLNVVEATESVVQVQTPGDKMQDLTIASYQLPLSLPVLGSLAVSLLIIIIAVVIRRKGPSSKGSAILLAGPSDAGKTAIHSTLVFGQTLPSHTSLQINISTVALPSPINDKNQTHPVTLIDIPGHPRIRNQFKEHLNKAKAIVFVVDSSTIARHGASVAEHLHHILHAIASLPPSQTPPPIVILAHKYDLLPSSSSPDNSASSLAISRVRTILERELEKRRASQAGGVGVTRLGEDEDAGTEMGGLECTGGVGSAFKFKDWEGGEIEILGTYVDVSKAGLGSVVVSDEKRMASEDGLAELKQWLQELP